MWHDNQAEWPDIVAMMLKRVLNITHITTLPTIRHDAKLLSLAPLASREGATLSKSHKQSLGLTHTFTWASHIATSVLTG